VFLVSKTTNSFQLVIFIVKLGEEANDSEAVSREEEDDVIIEPRLDGRPIKIRIHVQNAKLAELHRGDVFSDYANLVDFQQGAQVVRVHDGVDERVEKGGHPDHVDFVNVDQVPTQDCADVVVFLKKDGSFSVQIQQKGVEELVILGDVEQKHDLVEFFILEIITGSEHDSVGVQDSRQRGKDPCTE
jgi:hypothetical protein